MCKKLISMLLTCLGISSANAMQIHITPSSEYAAKQYATNFSYDIVEGVFPNVKHNTRKGDGLPFINFSKFFDDALNEELVDIHPSADIVSTLSLGYIKDGNNVSPESCQNIKLKEVNNIILDVNGCQAK